MPYDERTIQALNDSAEITPMGIQLEVNAEIFSTIFNLLSTAKRSMDVALSDLETLRSLWQTTIQAMAKVELRQSFGLPMGSQLSMLDEASGIHDKYIRGCLFEETSDLPCTEEAAQNERVISPKDMDQFFANIVWPSIITGKTGGLSKPMAYIIAGQPGSGKTRMSSIIINKYQGDIIQSMSDNFRGFHPHFQDMIRQYGCYIPAFTTEQGQYYSDLAKRRAIKERYHLLQEGSFENIDRSLSLIERLKENGYQVTVILRACPKKESWTAIKQTFEQQHLKAPGLSRQITKEFHDKACLHFLSATEQLVQQHMADRLIIKSPKGLMYDSDDMPTENVMDLLRRRMKKQ